MFLLSALIVLGIVVSLFIYFVYLGGEDMKIGGLVKFGAISITSVIVCVSCFVCLNRINPGEVGIVVDLFGSDKGVEQKELTKAATNVLGNPNGTFSVYGDITLCPIDESLFPELNKILAKLEEGK